MQFLYFIFVTSSVWDSFYNPEEGEAMQPSALGEKDNFTLVKIPLSGHYGETLSAVKELQEYAVAYQTGGEEIEFDTFDKILDEFPDAEVAS